MCNRFCLLSRRDVMATLCCRMSLIKPYRTILNSVWIFGFIDHSMVTNTYHWQGSNRRWYRFGNMIENQILITDFPRHVHQLRIQFHLPTEKAKWMFSVQLASLSSMVIDSGHDITYSQFATVQNVNEEAQAMKHKQHGSKNSLILDIGHSHRFVQRISMLLFQYWTLYNINSDI